MPDILVLGLWSVLYTRDSLSIGIQWIPSDCLGNGDSLSGESPALWDSLSGESLALSYTDVVRIPESILGSCHTFTLSYPLAFRKKEMIKRSLLFAYTLP